jgi:hypothetical protein
MEDGETAEGGAAVGEEGKVEVAAAAGGAAAKRCRRHLRVFEQEVAKASAIDSHRRRYANMGWAICYGRRICIFGSRGPAWSTLEAYSFKSAKKLTNAKKKLKKNNFISKKKIKNSIKKPKKQFL